MSGRKRMPNVVRLATRSHMERLNPAEPMPQGEPLNHPPAWMTEEQRAIWTRQLKNAPLGLLRDFDEDLMSEWTVSVSELRECERQIQKDGGPVVRAESVTTVYTKVDGTVVTTTKEGGKRISEWAKLRERAFQRMMRAVSELGFSPTSRARITLGGAKKDTNPFSKHAAAKRRA